MINNKFIRCFVFLNALIFCQLSNSLSEISKPLITFAEGINKTLDIPDKFRKNRDAENPSDPKMKMLSNVVVVISGVLGITTVSAVVYDTYIKHQEENRVKEREKQESKNIFYINEIFYDDENKEIKVLGLKEKIDEMFGRDNFSGMKIIIKEI